MALTDYFNASLLNGFNSSTKLLWYIAGCNLLWCIWYERNRLRHNTGIFSPNRFKVLFFNTLKDSASLAFKHASSTANNRPIFKLLGLSPLRASAPRFIPVAWKPPDSPWVKANTDGSFRNLNQAASGGVFRDHCMVFLGAFSKKVNALSAIDAEVYAFLEALTIAWSKGWNYLWLETDSMLVVHYFKKPCLIPWRLRTLWQNGLHLASQMNVQVSHVYREGNAAADALANYGADHVGNFWWDEAPQFLLQSLSFDASSRSSYRQT
ncbi:uncharacterized protein LOC133742818 [Rosa rugosa]|uniref:uncharacterized protein LOC133742818 n=1 Tax=Rosa rugosa TaxID=74645 RepID=UPI002B40F01D|nr:uncharacterized protein LOC133742818 [Rosa rugosa]